MGNTSLEAACSGTGNVVYLAQTMMGQVVAMTTALFPIPGNYSMRRRGSDQSQMVQERHPHPTVVAVQCDASLSLAA